MKFELSLSGGMFVPIAGIPTLISGSISAYGTFNLGGKEVSGGCMPTQSALCGSFEGGMQGKICLSPPGRIWRKLISVCVIAKGRCRGGGCSSLQGGTPTVSNCNATLSVEACGLFLCKEEDIFKCDAKGCRFENPLPSYW